MNPPQLFSNCVPWLSLLLAFVTHAHSATVTLEPSADTALYEGAPSNNLGGSTNLISGTTGQNNFSRALLKFAVASQIPSNSILTSARLVLRVVQLPASPVDSNFDLHQLLFDWGEGEKTGDFGSTASAGEATWTDRFFSQAAWTAPGASDTGDYLETSSASTFIGGLGNYEFTNLLADVQSWRDHPADNFGWILVSESENTVGTIKQFGSREAADPAVRPKLIIEYTPVQTVTLDAVADTSLFALAPDNNLGAASLVSGRIGMEPGETRALLRFNLAGSIPSDATLVSANLVLTVIGVPGGIFASAVDSNFGLHRLNVSWNEGNKGGAQGSLASDGETTWNNRAHSFISPTPWSSPGAAAPADFLAAISAQTLVSGFGSYTFSDLTADALFWLNNPASNFGWILISDNELDAGTARRFGNREDINNAPKLSLNYTLPPPPEITSVDTLGNDVRIHFIAQAGRPYVVECRDTLTAIPLICTNLPAQGVTGPVTINLPITGAQKFFRIGRQ
jgi:hypothetical protein